MKQNKPKLILITGGVRSGKSSFAQSLAQKSEGRIAFIATAQALDEEMAERIAEHRKKRPDNWETYEESCQVEKVIREIGFLADVIIIDCLNFLVANLMADFKDGKRKELLNSKIKEVIASIIEESLKSRASIIIVSNEVGSGLVPVNPAGRFFRDMLGMANQDIARHADLVYLMVAGIPLLIKGKNDE